MSIVPELMHSTGLLAKLAIIPMAGAGLRLQRRLDMRGRVPGRRAGWVSDASAIPRIGIKQRLKMSCML